MNTAYTMTDDVKAEWIKVMGQRAAGLIDVMGNYSEVQCLVVSLSYLASMITLMRRLGWPTGTLEEKASEEIARLHELLQSDMAGIIEQSIQDALHTDRDLTMIALVSIDGLQFLSRLS